MLKDVKGDWRELRRLSAGALEVSIIKNNIYCIYTVYKR